MPDENKSVFDDWDQQISSLMTPAPAPESDEPVVSIAELGGREGSLRQQIQKLDEKLANPEASYVVTNQQGQRVQDYMALERDRNARMRLRDELDDVRQQAQGAQARSRQWNDRLRQAASNFARGNMSRVPEGQRSAVGNLFKEAIGRYFQSGVLDDPARQNEQAVHELVSTAFNLALGNAVRESWKSEPASDPGNGPAPEPEAPQLSPEELELQEALQDERARAVYEASMAGKPKSLAQQQRDARDNS